MFRSDPFSFFDPAGRLTNRWSAAKSNTAYGYDPIGNLTNISYPVSGTISYSYDGLNRLIAMTDSIGTTAFSWTGGNQLASEDGPWANDTVSYGYTNRLRSAVSLQQPNASAWEQTYGYDSYGRLSTVTSPAGTFSYQYIGNSSPLGPFLPDLIYYLQHPNAAAINYRYYDHLGRLTNTALYGAASALLDSHAYVYDNGSQRTRHTFTDGNYQDYTYDGIGQLKTAKGFEGDTTPRVHEQFGYAYDQSWNLSYRTNNALVENFSADNLNQLTGVSRSGTLTVAGSFDGSPTSVTVKDNANAASAATVYGDNSFARSGITPLNGTNTFTAVAQDSYGRSDTNTTTSYLPSSVSLVYDANGNLRTNGTRILDYDDENQLIAIAEPGAWRSEFAYDGLMRRRIRREYTWLSGNWQLTNEVYYVYDGGVTVQERDANNIEQITYTRGNDIFRSFQGAGGIGGLLARTESRLLANADLTVHAFYGFDANGNVTALVNTYGRLAAKYSYDPFGNLLAKSGPLAEVNTYRFSSKEFHANSGLMYYLYRYYDSGQQRWLSRDPLWEIGGINLYGFVYNDPEDTVDPLGLDGTNECGSGRSGGGNGGKLVTPESAAKAATQALGDAVEKGSQKVLKDTAMKPLGRGATISPLSGATTAIGKTVVSAGVGLLNAGPGLTQNANMAIPNNKLKLADPFDGDAQDKALEAREKVADKCNDVSRKANP